MTILSNVLVALVAALHLWFLTLEMFLWRKPKGLKTFGTTQEFADATAVLAANQGLYNGFLAAGLIWGMTSSDSIHGFSIKVFFLSCVVVAGVFGAITADKRILFIQAFPAALALAVLSFLA